MACILISPISGMGKASDRAGPLPPLKPSTKQLGDQTMRVSRILVGTFIAATLPAAAWAQATAQEAEAIRQGLQAWIADNLQTPEFSVQFAGDIEVTPSGSEYRVALPPTDIVFVGDGRVAIGFFDMTLRPTVDGHYDATWQMPERFPILEGDGREVGVITIDKQFGTGVFAPAYETFLTMEMSLDDIVIRPTEEEGEMSISSVAMTADSDELGDGIYNSEFEMTLDEIEFSDGRGAHFDLGLITIGGTIDAIDLPAYLAFTHAFNDIIEPAGQTGAPDGAMFSALADLMERTPQLFDSFEIEYGIQDLFFEDVGERVQIGEAQYVIFIDGLHDDASSLGMSLAVEDIDVSPQPPQFQYVPQESVIDVALEDLPNDQLLTIVIDFLRNSAQTGPDNAVMMAGVQLQQAVMAGGSTLQIEEVTALADLYSLLMDGEIVPNPAAAFGVTANAFMEIGGMPGLIAALQAEPDGQQAVQGLTVLQGLGQLGTDDDGNEVRVYELDLRADGTFLLNGTDMGPILQGLMR